MDTGEFDGEILLRVIDAARVAFVSTFKEEPRVLYISPMGMHLLRTEIRNNPSVTLRRTFEVDKVFGMVVFDYPTLSDNEIQVLSDPRGTAKLTMRWEQ